MKIAALFALAGIASASAADIVVTEAFTGLSGEDGTVDWFEITNTGASAFDTGTLAYDDDSAALADGGILDSVMLGAGQSMIVLISDDNEASDDVTYASAIEEFNAIWGYTGLIGLSNGGGGLGQGGDQINLIDVMTETVISFVDVPGALSGGLSTIQFDEMGNASPSIAGVNGAYSSIAFFNDNLGLPGNEAVLVGNPGFVPAPGAVAMLGLGGLIAGRRRR